VVPPAFAALTAQPLGTITVPAGSLTTARITAPARAIPGGISPKKPVSSHWPLILWKGVPATWPWVTLCIQIIP